MIADNTHFPTKHEIHQPRIVISVDDLTHIEALAEAAMQRNPALAERLLDELSRACIVTAEEMPKTVVGIGSLVTYKDEASGQERRVTLVYPDEADIARQRISVMTPIGVALLGLSEGAAFYWDTRNDQKLMLTVTQVEQPVTTGIVGD